MTERTREEWWSIEPPEGWSAGRTPECFQIDPPSGDGSFQLSAYRNEKAHVTEGDLLEFADHHIRNGAPRRDVRLGDFVGFEITYDAEGLAYREWYLRCRATMIYATFVCDEEERGRHDEEVELSLVTLRAVD